MARALREVLRRLERFHGPPPNPVSRDPFRLILYEQVAYLVPDAQRRAAYRRLAREVGLTPQAILHAAASRLVAVARAGGGIAPAVRAARMRKTATLTITTWGGKLRRALELPLRDARRALAQFPMIGAPGAERILAATGAHAVLGLDSNGLRVLLRLGWGKEHRDYGRTYRSVQDALAAELPAEPSRLAGAAAQLRRHGQLVCRRAAPDCAVCPLVSLCTYGRSHARPARRKR